MSEATEHTPSQCDSLLDYVYGELSGDALEQFKLHLLTCEKCKRELAGLERVRTAVKQAMPQVEPPADKLSQLLHAAAQQKPKQRGKMLMFARRMVSHPAYAAAAAVVIVGGAVAYNFSMGHIAMPAAEKALHEPLAPQAPAAATPTVDEPQAVGGTLPAGAPEEKPAAPAPGIAKPMESFASHHASEPKMVLKTEAPAEYAVTRAPARKEAPGVAMDGRMRAADKVGYLGKGKDSSLDVLSDHDDGVIDLQKQQSGGAAGGSISTRRHSASSGELARGETEKNVVTGAGVAMKPAPVVAAAPPPPPPEPAKRPAKKMAMEENDRQAEGGVVARNQAATAPTTAAPAPAAVPAPAQPAPGVQALQQPSQQQREISSNESPSQTAVADNKARRKGGEDQALAMKKKAQAAADNGNCDEAKKIYEEIDKQFPKYLTATDRAAYTRCVRVNNNAQMAEQQVDQENSKATVASKSGKKAKAAAPAAAKPPASSTPSDKAADKAAY
jgi:hypothetical protein